MVHLLPVIKGLKSEVAEVEEAFKEASPDLVAISLSQEELDGLRNMPDDFEPELSRYEELYAEGLSRFGEVAAPPPCYVASVEIADHEKIPVVAVDLDEKSFTDLYCAAVSGTALFRHSTRTWNLKRKRSRGETAGEFVMAWDRAVNNMEGFRTIERKRAEVIAKGIREAAKRSDRLLAVVELERSEEVMDRLRRRSEEDGSA